MANTSRNELKQYFQKGKIPTQAQFEALIDSGMNQLDDRIRAAPNEALALLPGTGEAVLRFAQIQQTPAGESVTPTWLLKHEPSGAASPGLLFQNADGQGALYLSSGSGYVGVGTTSPGAQLEVKAQSLTWNGWLEAIRFSRAEHSAITHPESGLLFGLHGNRKFYFADMKKAGPAGYLVTIDASTGNVGIGTTEPDRPLTILPPAGSVEWLSLKSSSGETASQWHLNNSGGGINFAETRTEILLGPRGPRGPLDPNRGDLGDLGRVGTTRNVYAARLFIAPGGNLGIGTSTPGAKLQVVGGAIMPSVGPGEDAGLLWPPDPFGGSGDRAWIRYHNQRGGEKSTLELGVANDGDDHIVLKPSGNVGVGVDDPGFKLDVGGVINATNARPIRSQMVHRRTLWGLAGDPPYDFGSGWVEVAYVYGPFTYALPAVQPGATRRFRLYAVYSDTMTTEGVTQVALNLLDGNHQDALLEQVLFSLPRTWGAIGPRRDGFSDEWVGTPNNAGRHAKLYFRTTVAGRVARITYLELQAWDEF